MGECWVGYKVQEKLLSLDLRAISRRAPERPATSESLLARYYSNNFYTFSPACTCKRHAGERATHNMKYKIDENEIYGTWKQELDFHGVIAWSAFILSAVGAVVMSFYQI